MHGTDDLKLRILGDALMNALGDLVVDKDAGKAADFEQVAAVGELVLEVEDLVVCTENLNPGVAVMESAQDGKQCDAPGPLNRARDRRIFIQ
jgi:hypothetical protein